MRRRQKPLEKEGLVRFEGAAAGRPKGIVRNLGRRITGGECGVRADEDQRMQGAGKPKGEGVVFSGGVTGPGQNAPADRILLVEPRAEKPAQAGREG